MRIPDKTKIAGDRKEKKMDQLELDKRFTYHAPKEGQTEKYEGIRYDAKEMANSIDRVCPESREKSLAFTKLEEAVFWANASIARNE